MKSNQYYYWELTLIITTEPYILKNFIFSEFVYNSWGLAMGIVIFDLQDY